jgi:ComF family protein
MFHRLIDPILSTVYPQTCHVCHGIVDRHADGVACADCWESTHVFDGTEILCEKCGAIAKDGRLDGSNRCGQCNDGHYDAALACGVYEKAIAATVIRLKKEPYLPERVNEMLRQLAVKFSPVENGIVLSVPLSKKRRFERGHNQAEIIGRIIGKHSGLPFSSFALQRTDSSPMHRVGMDKKAREATVKNSFVVAAPRLIDGKNVVLVDDVFTSGSTASFCARALKKNGAASVMVITLARAVMYK